MSELATVVAIKIVLDCEKRSLSFWINDTFVGVIDFNDVKVTATCVFLRIASEDTAWEVISYEQL